jgi:uroporphyrinogen III methyltransferase / synthase
LSAFNEPGLLTNGWLYLMDKSEQSSPDTSSGTNRSPLGGKTVLVTRGRAQSSDITAQLEALGATVIHCPSIEIAPPTSWDQLDASIGRLGEYDWIVFTSANGVEFFFRRLVEIRGDATEALAKHLTCAIGPATARALAEAGAAANVVASDSTAEGAQKAIIDYLGGPEFVRGLSFLIPRARIARDILPAGLRRLGARVDAVETYQTLKPNVERESIISLFEENSIDAITFTSSSTVANFAALLGLTDLSGLLSNTVVACIGPITAKTAAKHGLRETIQPEVYNATELVNSIVESIGQNRKSGTSRAS